MLHQNSAKSSAQARSPDASARLCPLCRTAGCEPVRGADDRSYYRCGHCLLIFADARHRLSRAEEAAHYRTHENGIHQRGYVEFLDRVIEPMLPHLRPSTRGLDFGCGPGPTLSLLVRRQGIACEDYDPIFHDVPLTPPYDFLFATECFEHFFSPARELERICGLLRPGGLLGIMTELWTDLSSFQSWYYTRDPTHVSFFHERTMEFICGRYGFERLWSDGRRVILLRYHGRQRPS